MIPSVSAKTKPPMILILNMMVVRVYFIPSLIFSSFQGVLEGEHQTLHVAKFNRLDAKSFFQSRQTKIIEF